MAGKTIGLTTSQAARYCLVSPDTIVKWIKSKNLPAQRTIGGQFRIFVEGLRQFMVRHGMSTALLDAELDCRSYCWEFHGGARGGACTPGMPCSACPVYRTKALNCFELRAINDAGSWAHDHCEGCAYYQKWAHTSRTETPEK